MGDLERRWHESRGLAVTVARRFKPCTGGVYDWDDVRQVADLALWDALRRFDPARGLSFSTFAVPYIRGRILNWFRDFARQIPPTMGGNVEGAPDPRAADVEDLDAAPVEPDSDPRLADVRAMRDAGFRAKEIARRIGVPPRVVREWMGGERYAHTDNRPPRGGRNLGPRRGGQCRPDRGPGDDARCEVPADHLGRIQHPSGVLA